MPGVKDTLLQPMGHIQLTELSGVRVIGIPPTAVWARVGYQVLSTAAGSEVHYLDDVTLQVKLSNSSYSTNLLDPTRSTFETASGWSTNGGTNCTGSRQSTQARTGTWGYQISSTASGNMEGLSTNAADSTMVPIVSGMIGLIATGYTRTAVSARSVRLKIYFYDASFAQVGVVFGATVTNSSASWTAVSCDAMLPQGVKTIKMVGATQPIRWRDDGTDPTSSVGMRLQAGTVFDYPGKPQSLRFIETAASATLNIACYS